jgi:hypothetical protein
MAQVRKVLVMNTPCGERMPCSYFNPLEVTEVRFG